MVPIHDTDIAEERWARSEWKHYELWEKLELKLRRRKNLWILGALIIFLALSAVPIVIDRWPKWTCLKANRLLAREINALKRQAGLEHVSLRIRFDGGRSLSYTIEKAERCASTDFTQVRAGHLMPPKEAAAYALLTPEDGQAIGMPGLVNSFCYDHLSGAEVASKGENVFGFAITPVKDLTIVEDPLLAVRDCLGNCAENGWRVDRISVLLLSGSVAELSFE